MLSLPEKLQSKQRMVKVSGLPKMVPRRMFLCLTDDGLTCIFWIVNNLFAVLFPFLNFFQDLFSTFIKTVGRKVSPSIIHFKQVNRFVNTSNFRQTN